jgi:hypothetical protein
VKVNGIGGWWPHGERRRTGTELVCSMNLGRVRDMAGFLAAAPPAPASLPG